jgi:hypothetical protein
LQSLAAQVQVTHGRLHVAVSQQTLQGCQVGARLQHVGGVAVPQRMDGRGFGQSRHDQRLTDSPLQDRPVQRFALTVGKEIIVRPVNAPVGPQLLEQTVRQGHTAILATLAAAHPQQTTSAVDVGQTKLHHLAQTQPAPVSQP